MNTRVILLILVVSVFAGLSCSDDPPAGIESDPTDSNVQDTDDTADSIEETAADDDSSTTLNDPVAEVADAPLDGVSDTVETLDPNPSDLVDSQPDPPLSDSEPDLEPDCSAGEFALVDDTGAAESCPWALCGAWPDASQGTVYLYESEESYGDLNWTRSFHVYVPAGLTEPVPVLMVLHGGTGNGVTQIRHLSFDEMADHRGSDPGIGWDRNNESCRMVCNNAIACNRQPAGCELDRVTFFNDQRFILVLPDGIADEGETDKRHWEDGRVPSPGHTHTDEQQRDDVGFINHIVEFLADGGIDRVDPERIYLAGVSNGGMMTQRVLCHASDSCYPALARVAAYSVVIASMPEAIFSGLSGRAQCASSGDAPLPMIHLMDDGIDTPQCWETPCDLPDVNGDGIIPFGEAGHIYNIYSPFPGRSIAADDAHQHWLDYHTESGMGDAVTVSSDLELSTTIATSHFGELELVQHYVTDAGAHILVSAGDYNVSGRVWDFVSTFRRRADGGVERVDSPVHGEF